jgi:phospholipase C
MGRNIIHDYFSLTFDQSPPSSGRFDEQRIPVRINRVGRLEIKVTAQHVSKPLPPPPDTGHPGTPRPPGGNKPIVSTRTFPYTLLDPDGNPFNRNEITLADLDRYRDLRGFTAVWTLAIPPSSFPNTDFSFISGPLTASLKIHERLASSSAPELVNETGVLTQAREFEFDLYHIGVLRVTARRSVFGLRVLPALLGNPVSLSLITPDGHTLASSNNGNLSLNIEPTLLRLSRGPNGKPLAWKLRVQANDNHKYRIHARVYNTLRVPRSVLLSRLHALLGVNGEKLTITGNWNNQLKTNVFTLTINDTRLAETFGIHGILSHLDRALNPGMNVREPEPGRAYVLKRDSLVLEEGTFRKQAKFNNLKSEKIRIEMGPSVERRALKLEEVSSSGGQPGPKQYKLVPTGEILLPQGLPSFALTVEMSGTVKIEVKNWDDAEVVVPALRIEIGLEVNSSGRIRTRIWVDPDSVRFGGSEGSPHHPLKNDVNDLKKKVAGLADDLSGLTGIFEGIFDRMLGGAFQFTVSRFSGDAMELEYLAGKEHERKPNPGYVARGDFGIGVGPGGPILPGPLGRDTWVSPNLSKIDHIVVLIMENRSFDHVLGYLSLGSAPVNSNVDGLTDSVIQEFSSNTDRIRPLREAGFAANAAGLKTRIPLDVGHGVKDVLQQLQIRSGRATMKGFAANFRDKYPQAEFDRTGCTPQDALGYYTDAELPMYGFLAREFAICDNFYCSHPGPTLPNRMFSLTGDLQRDRNGEPRIHNSIDTTFFLSRDQTIFDVLTRRQVSWRVYESFPSVTMLRMFSRYAGDDEDIRDIKNLESDIIIRGLPSVTFIDPAMHDAPANDDHPPADMLHGQHLIRRIYKALRSNDAVWRKTLFVITYDEHGGLFDHVPPPVAEVLQDPRVVLDREILSPERSGPAPGGGRIGVVDRPVIHDRVIDISPAPPRNKPNIQVDYGVRVPTFLLSPYVEKGSVYKSTTDHASILKTILIRFCGADRPFLSDRVHHAVDLGRHLTLNEPRQIQTEPPVLPTLPDARLRTKRSAIRISQLTSERADFHEFMHLLSTVVKPD